MPAAEAAGAAAASSNSMRNRWFHLPRLHSPAHGGEKKVGWLELFYDLVFVAAFIQLGNGLSKHPTPAGFAAFAAAFAAMWITWSGFTYFMNRFSVDDFLQRMLVFGQMFCVGGMAVTAPSLLDGEHRTFALAYALSQLFVGIFNLRAWIQVPQGRGWSGYWGSVFTIGALLWLVAIAVPAPWAYVLMTAGVLVIFSAPLNMRHRGFLDRHPIDEEHLSERFGLLTLIVLGESFVKVLDAATSSGAGLSLLGQASVLLLLTLSIWWIYFDDVAGSEVRGHRFTPTLWWIGHLPLQMAVTATGVGIKKAATLDLSAAAGDAYRWLLCGSLGLVLWSVAMIDSVTERRQAELSDRARVGMRASSGALMLLLAASGGRMSAGTFLLLATTLLVAQVIFDMMMAPFEDAPDHEIGAVPLAERDRALQELAVPAGPPADLTESLRKGTPTALRQDLYFFFMHGGWGRLLAAFAFVWVMVNVFFATIYTLRPDSIDPHRDLGFADAFAFSVQTISTIGYGTMSPASAYGDAIVTIEAAVGLLGVALATGLVFAKVSRPVAKILFSDKLLITRWYGAPTLTFRVGNVRGNDIVDAKVHVVAVCNEFSPEGDHMRRLYDLELVRNRSPMFALSWTILHPLDERSPLSDIDWRKRERYPLAVIVTLTGHDGTYGQTVYARQVYGSGQIQPGQRFVDILSQLPDGRLMVDYHRFHDTVEQEPAEQDALKQVTAEREESAAT